MVFSTITGREPAAPGPAPGPGPRGRRVPGGGRVLLPAVLPLPHAQEDAPQQDGPVLLRRVLLPDQGERDVH